MTTKVTKIEPYKNHQIDTIVCRGIYRKITHKQISPKTLEVVDGEVKHTIISVTENIYSSDFVTDGMNIIQLPDNVNEIDACWAKVIALPQNFSPKLLKSISDGKLKDGDEILIECEGNKITCGYEDINGLGTCNGACQGFCDWRYLDYKIRFNEDNYIRLFPVKQIFSTPMLDYLRDYIKKTPLEQRQKEWKEMCIEIGHPDVGSPVEEEESWDEIINKAVEETDNGNLLFYKSYFNKNYNPPTRK